MAKTKYTLLLDDDALAEIERLKDYYGYSEKVAVYGLAVRLLGWAAEHAANGRRIGFMDGEQFRELEMETRRMREQRAEVEQERADMRAWCAPNQSVSEMLRRAAERE